MLSDFRAYYYAICDERDRIASIYDADFANHPYFSVRSGPLPAIAGYFRPAFLPRSTTLPCFATVCDPESTSHPPAQRALSMVAHHGRWLTALEAARDTDASNPLANVRYREATRLIAVSQPCASGWLDMAPDGTAPTAINSPCFAYCMQRRRGLDIAAAAAANEALEAAGQ